MKHIIFERKSWYSDNYNITFISEEEEWKIISLFMNIDTPIKEMVGEERRKNREWITDIDELLNGRYFSKEEWTKITLNEEERQFLEGSTTLYKDNSDRIKDILKEVKGVKVNEVSLVLNTSYIIKSGYMESEIKRVLQAIKREKILETLDI